jgi:hypothetical protein
MGGSAPTDGNGMSTREHWDEGPSVFDLRRNVCVMGVGATRQGKTRELTGKPVHAREDDGWRWVGRPYGWQWNVNERTLGWMSQCFWFEVRCPRDGVGVTRQGKTRKLPGKPSMQEGMMDGDGRVSPTDGNGMSTREHWDECPSVFDLRWDVRVVGCRGDSIPFGYPSGQDEKIDGGTVHARGDDGWRWVGRPYGWQWNVNERTLG